MTLGLDLQDWLAIISIILTFVAIIIQYKDKISQTKVYKKIAAKVSVYYSLGIRKKFLIISVVLAFIGVSLISISIYQIKFPSPTVQNNTIYPKDFIEEGRGGLLGISEPDKVFFVINKNQGFLWKRGWAENKKLRKIQIDYITNGTRLIIFLGSNQTFYELKATTSGTINIDSKNILIEYEKGIAYYVFIVNLGENPFYLLEIKTEEEVLIPKDRAGIMLMLGYISIMFAAIVFKKHRIAVIDEKTKFLDILEKEAKYADRIKNIEMELNLHQNMLKQLEELNLKEELSPNFYRYKKSNIEENIRTLTEEKNIIASEIEDILGKFKKE